MEVQSQCLVNLFGRRLSQRILSGQTRLECVYHVKMWFFEWNLLFQDEFLDVIYWLRQALGIFIGIIWGFIPLKGFLGLVLCVYKVSSHLLCSNLFRCRFAIVNVAIIYAYFSTFQKVDEDEFGGTWELTKEGFMTSFAGFLVGNLFLYNEESQCMICWMFTIIIIILFVGYMDNNIFWNILWMTLIFLQ